MLGCHDGIPVLDLKGMIPEERIEELVELLKSRGGFVKDLHAKKKLYYQVNATYLSALGGDEDDLVLARAIQLFMPGKPQIWYLDLLAGRNDIEAVERAGSGGHKEINRTNLSMADAETALAKDSVKKQLELLKLRASHPAFSPEADIKVNANGPVLTITWSTGDDRITLEADLKSRSYKII
jgi:sucrose phosphorylase